ncbi:MAG: hypothetical protein AB7I42_26010 [Bradyrhizobium sp.]|uniref:hypothetical protein n=1 Tax=Bradyrhizobium sp. TaxID=376 RepID=UPI003D108A67
MATMLVCDGCGHGIIGPPVKHGLVIRRDYCVPCSDIVQKYLDELNALHERLALAWKEGLETIRQSYREKVTHLPDDNATVRENAVG